VAAKTAKPAATPSTSAARSTSAVCRLIVHLDDLARARIDQDGPVVDHDVPVFDVGNLMQLNGIR